MAIISGGTIKNGQYYNPDGSIGRVDTHSIVNPNSAMPGASVPKPITIDGLMSPQSPAVIPPAPLPTSGNSAVATGQNAITNFPKDGGGDDLMTKLLSAFPERQSDSAGDYKTAQQDPDYLAKVLAEQQAKSAQRAAEAELQGFSNQIQGLMNEREVLKQEAEKNIPAGVPREILNRQQLRIERDTASKILPLQMQALVAQSKVANLRGNTELASEALASAKEQMNTYFTLQQKDADANYKYKLDTWNAIKDVVGDYRKEEMEAKKTKVAQDFSRETIFRQDIGVAVGKAIDAGQPNIAEAMRQIDPLSPTAREELARLEGRIKPKNENVWSEPYNLGGDFVQKNKVTGEIRTAVNVPKGDIDINSPSNFVDVMQRSIDAGATPEEAAREAVLASQNNGITVDQKTLTTWTEQARKLKKTPVVIESEKPKAKIEVDIEELSSGGILQSGDIRPLLRKRGYTDSEIANSSVGNTFEKVKVGIEETLQKVEGFFSNLFGG